MEGELRRLQEYFWHLITARENVERTLPALAEKLPNIAPLERWIAASDGTSAAARLDVYANMYFFRLLEILREDFPKLAALVGDRHFQNLATDYLFAQPSRNSSVRHVGDRLTEFVRSHPLADTWPYLAELAKLERARVDVFDRADSPLLQREELGRIPPERWADLRFRAIPALELLETSFPIEKVWLALEKGDPVLSIEPAPTVLIVWRHQFKVFHRTVSPGELASLQPLLGGETFGSGCEGLEALCGHSAPQTMNEFLGRWITDGLFQGVHP